MVVGNWTVICLESLDWSTQHLFFRICTYLNRAVCCMMLYFSLVPLSITINFLHFTFRLFSILNPGISQFFQLFIFHTSVFWGSYVNDGSLRILFIDPWGCQPCQIIIIIISIFWVVIMITIVIMNIYY